MRIGLYTLFLFPGQIGGIETYLRQLILNLGKVDRQNQYILLLSAQNRIIFNDIDFPNFEKVCIPLTPPAASLTKRALRKLKLSPSYLAERLDACRLDLLHYPGTTIDQLELKTPCVLTIHDIQQEYFPQFFPAAELAWRKANFQPSAQKARRIITVSEYTRQTILDKYGVPPAKAQAIHYGVGDIFQPNLKTTVVAHIRRQYQLPDEFIFFPANAWPHKNHERLFEAVKLVRQKYGIFCPVVVSGIFGQGAQNLETLISQTGAAEFVRVLGYIPYQDLPAIYTAATALVFPSLFEGFGIPVLEAMACGCPVICANTTSLPELAGQAALLINPLDVAQIAEAIYNVFRSEALRQTMRRQGLAQVKNFSWETAARQTAAVYQSV